jgi:hypothetical protein
MEGVRNVKTLKFPPVCGVMRLIRKGGREVLLGAVGTYLYKCLLGVMGDPSLILSK